jgi:hypothetical protein
MPAAIGLVRRFQRNWEALAEAECREAVPLDARKLMADVRFFKDNRLLSTSPSSSLPTTRRRRCSPTSTLAREAVGRFPASH